LLTGSTVADADPAHTAAKPIVPAIHMHETICFRFTTGSFCI
jgi:hypothetical protein